jgi:hypothetical protein
LLVTVSCYIDRTHALLGQVYASQAETQHAIEEYAFGLPATIIDLSIINLEGPRPKAPESNLVAHAFADSKALN